MILVDVHAHLSDEQYENVDEVIARAYASGVEKIVCSAYNLSSSQKAVELAKKYRNVFATVGIHPENVNEIDEKTFAELEKLASCEKVVAIGEIGLDYHFVQDNKELQKRVFEKQISLANSLSLPVQIHSRDAMGDTLEILKKHKPNKESLLHCYSGSLESAKILMDLGFSFSFGGVVTFSNAKNVVEVVKNLPMDRILLETDCPYMSPVPFRGTRNEPRNVLYVADAISRIKGISFEDVIQKTTQNAERLFKI